MSRLTCNDIKFFWDLKCERSFLSLHKSLTTASILTLPQGNDDFALYTYASQLDLECSVMQHGNGKVVAYTSRQVRIHEQYYATHDLELVAVLFALKYGATITMACNLRCSPIIRV